MIPIQLVFAENLELNDIQNAREGSIVKYTLTFNSAPNRVGAFGFEIAYNPNMLSYQSYELAEGFQDRFDFFQGNKKENGLLVFGGYSTSQKIESGESGALLIITFTVVNTSHDTITLQNLKDDFKNWSVKNGHFNPQSAILEDIDNDGKLGLAEVIYLLQKMTGIYR